MCPWGRPKQPQHGSKERRSEGPTIHGPGLRSKIDSTEHAPGEALPKEANSEALSGGNRGVLAEPGVTEAAGHQGAHTKVASDLFKDLGARGMAPKGILITLKQSDKE